MRVFSGIQPTGNLHLGNYLGALQQFVQLQDEGNDGIFCVVDLHALTGIHDGAKLRELVQEAKRVFLAAGLTSDKSTLFVQSEVPAHAELTWIFSTMTPMGELERMTQFKDKKTQGMDTNAGLFTYPILMAADILLYNTEAVPVGEDQLQHLELARTIARKFNSTYGELFREPKALVRKETARVMSLQDPTKKMSKSLGPTHYVGLFEDEDSIRDKFKRAVTDSGSDITYDPENKPGVSNLLSIYAGMTNTTPQDAQTHFASKNYGQLKEEVAETVLETLKPMRERFNELTEIDIEAAFQQGREKANAEAEKTLKEVKKKVGL